MDHRDRCFRPRAFNDPGHYHELTISCFRRLPLLSKERSCEWLAEAITETKNSLGYALWAYVFMPDHVHLLVMPRQRSYNISAFLANVKRPVGRAGVRFLQAHAPEWLPQLRRTNGQYVRHHFWQPGRGYDRNIYSGRTLQLAIDYIHLNPVRRGLVDRPNDWKWSSASWSDGAGLNSLRPDPIPWDWLETDA